MPIIDTEKDKNGNLWGFDDDAQKWVPLDESFQKGSFAGNLGRAALGGFESVGQGITELTYPDDPGVAARGAALRAGEEAQSRSAPWATALGGGAPELLAGAALAVPTAGTGLLPILGAQALAGGAIGAVRSAESASDRAANAAFGAASALIGEGVGAAAAPGLHKAMSAGMKMAEAVTARGAGRLADEAAVAEQRVAAQRAAAQPAGEGQAAPGMPAQPPQPGAGSVGAAQTPEALRDPLIARETEALNVDDATGATIQNPGAEAEREAAVGHGYKDPWYAGTRQGSAARNMAAQGFELLPGSEAVNASVKNANDALKARLTGRALGLGDNTARDVISDADLMQAADRTAKGFDRVREELPNIGNSEYMRALEKADVELGAVGADRGESIIADMKARLSKNETAHVSPKAFMRDIQKLTAEMAKAARDGDSNSAELLGQTVNHLYNLGEQATKNAPSAHGAHGRDPEVVSRQWAEVRKEWQMLRMITAPGVRDPTGGINSQALYRQMTRDPKSGGWGISGPPEGSELRPLFEVIRYDRGAGKSQVPMTGVRAAMQIARLPMALGLGAAGVNTLGNALGGLWD